MGLKTPMANEYFQFSLNFNFKGVLDLLESSSNIQSAPAYSTPSFLC